MHKLILKYLNGLKFFLIFISVFMGGWLFSEYLNLVIKDDFIPYDGEEIVIYNTSNYIAYPMVDELTNTQYFIVENTKTKTFTVVVREEK